MKETPFSFGERTTMHRHVPSTRITDLIYNLKKNNGLGGRVKKVN